MNRNIFYWTVLSVLLSLTAYSCKKAPLTNGDIITVTRAISAFDSIYLHDNVDVTLIKSDCYKIELTTCENLADNIITDVSNSSLIVRNDNTLNWIRDYDYPLDAKIYYASDISKIYYNSVGILYSDDYIFNDSLSDFDLIIYEGGGKIDLKVRCKELYLDSDGGATEVNIKGKGIKSDIKHNSYGPVYTTDFKADTTKVFTLGNNDVYLSCEDYLTSYIYGYGNVFYKGNPEIHSFISQYAEGKLIPIDN